MNDIQRVRNMDVDHVEEAKLHFAVAMSKAKDQGERLAVLAHAIAAMGMIVATLSRGDKEVVKKLLPDVENAVREGIFESLDDARAAAFIDTLRNKISTEDS